MTHSNWAKARSEVLLFCQRMLNERLVYYTAGNISCRIEGEPELIAITPTSLPYDTMQPEDIVVLTINGRVIDGNREPTSEQPLHTLIYQRRSDIGAVVHTHSLAGMAMSALGAALPPILNGLITAAGGSVVTAPFARAGTAEMADFTAAALENRSACFIRNHGVLAIGVTLSDAYCAAVTVENSAEAYLKALAAGQVLEIPADEIERLHLIWKNQWQRPGAQ
jgi:L-ribulose-5-phosphate 4-epimerase